MFPRWRRLNADNVYTSFSRMIYLAHEVLGKSPRGRPSRHMGLSFSLVESTRLEGVDMSILISAIALELSEATTFRDAAGDASLVERYNGLRIALYCICIWPYQKDMELHLKMSQGTPHWSSCIMVWVLRYIVFVFGQIRKTWNYIWKCRRGGLIGRAV